jgi:hypothetical protein
MRRRVFDTLTSFGGVVLVVVLLVAGGLLMWGYSFTHSNVHKQLSEQQIFFPPKAAFAQAKPGTEITPGMLPYLEKYAGQQLLSGQQAQAYADHFIAVHLSQMPYHGIYSKISAAALAKPNDASLKALEQASFQGTTLRGLLLEAYGFSTVGVIMFWGAIASFGLALIMLILVGLGLRHARRTPPEVELFAHVADPRPERVPVGAAV